jgi:hypothetical protein
MDVQCYPAGRANFSRSRFADRTLCDSEATIRTHDMEVPVRPNRLERFGTPRSGGPKGEAHGCAVLSRRARQFPEFRSVTGDPIAISIVPFRQSMD